MLPICNVKLKAQKPCRLPLPPKEDTSLGAELKRRRLTLGWSQQETANYFNVLKDSYQKWEWNQITPHIKNRKKVVEFLDYNYWDNGSDSLANRCLLFRIEHGITRAKLASRISISEATMDTIENNKIAISNETIVKVEAVLQIEKKEYIKNGY